MGALAGQVKGSAAAPQGNRRRLVKGVVATRSAAAKGSVAGKGSAAGNGGSAGIEGTLEASILDASARAAAKG